MILGDLGAEVIKVERPGAGDDTRAWGPPFAGAESVYFLSVNRNKKSIAINIKDSKGAKLIRELAAVSDVFVENYIPGKLAEMGLGYEDIKKIAPHIVYCSITGFSISYCLKLSQMGLGCLQSISHWSCGHECFVCASCNTTTPVCILLNLFLLLMAGNIS
uniref:Succinate--hydroxymethylglutarate CoA-transferase n=1 Tax=Accipiter nisus TaxID=211598 RepID=A0A8B9N2M0_9AVES